MADIDALIARPIAFDPSRLADPFKGYMEGRDMRRVINMENAFAGGLPKSPDGTIDFPRMLDTLAKYGKPDSIANLATIGMELRNQEKGEQAARDFAAMFSPVGQAQPQRASQAMPQQPRAVVPSTSRVWGDREAEEAGLYEPTRPAQTAQVAPQRSPAPMAAQTTNPVTGNISALIAATANPRLPVPQREMAKTLLTKALDDSKLTDEQKEYILYQAQERGAGRAPKSFLDFKVTIKRAGAPPAGENEYDKTTGGQFAKYNMEMIQSANNARTKIGTLDRLGQLLSDPSVYTGTGGPFVATLKRAASSLGIDVSDIKDGSANADAIRSISNQFALELRNPAGGAGMPGAMSDKDREFLQSMVPGLSQTPEGNKLILDYMKRVAQRSIDVERQRQSYVRKTGRLDEGFFRELSAWADKNPLFPEADRVSPTTAPNAQQAPREGQAGTGVRWRVIE